MIILYIVGFADARPNLLLFYVVNNIINPSTNNNNAKIFLSIATGSVCASFAPSGANSMLAEMMAINAGQ